MINNLKTKNKSSAYQNLYLLYAFLRIALTIDIKHAKDFQPIGTVNPSKYIPAQKQIAESKNGMVTTQHFLATRVGEKILNKGGNAYDAAIAVGFHISCCTA